MPAKLSDLPYPPVVRHVDESGHDNRVSVSEYRTVDRPNGGSVTIGVFLGNHTWAEATIPPEEALVVARLILSKPSVAALEASDDPRP